LGRKLLMLLKEFITKLQLLYDNETKDPEYLEMMGEPTIEIDVFVKDKNHAHLFKYAGFSPAVSVERSSDGVYMILNRFAKDENSSN
jgi:hypothetical protein